MTPVLQTTPPESRNFTSRLTGNPFFDSRRLIPDGVLIWVVVPALCADSFEPQARRYSKLGHYLIPNPFDAAFA
jgi:hypothetical protein